MSFIVAIRKRRHAHLRLHIESKMFKRRTIMPKRQSDYNKVLPKKTVIVMGIGWFLHMQIPVQ